jgi:hypothetical protein
MGATATDSCTDISKILKILPFTSQYIYFSALFVVNNKCLFKENSEAHNIKTGNNPNLFQPPSHLTIYQKGLYCFGIKMYNNPPCKIKQLSCNIKQFKTSLMNFLEINSFYILVEYFSYKSSNFVHDERY